VSAAIGARRPSFAGALAAVALAALAVRGCGLAGQPGLADDRNCGASAVNFVERGQIGPTMWHHPHLRDLLVYASGSLAGFGRVGVVLPSLLLGVLSVVVLGLLGRRLAGPAAGLAAAALAALDSLHVDYSRQAVQEIYTFAFAATGVLLALLYAERRRGVWLVAAGVAFGLGLGAKWSVAFPLAVTAAWLVAAEARARAAGDLAAGPRAVFAIAALLLLPAAVYLLTWTPWMIRGHDLSDLVELHARMAAEARVHQGFNPFNLDLPHAAWMWFVRPVAFADFTFGPSGPVPVVAVTNPLVWLATIPAVALVARRARRQRRPEDVLLVALFVATYLPFVLLSRPIWVHSALAVLPFALVAVGSAATDLARAGPRARSLVLGWALLSALAAAPLLALATGHGMELGALRGLVERFRPDARFEGAGPR